ncbi:MAG: ATP-binding protein [Rhizomicrobium sp.]
MRSFHLWTISEPPRVAEARLRLLVETLPSTIGLNPLWTIVLFLPLLRASGLFGRVPLWHFFLAFALHAALSAAATAIWLRNRHRLRNPAALRWQLVALQFGIGVVWGTVLCLFNVRGNTVSSIYLCMMFVSVVWSMVFTRAALLEVLFAGVVPITLIYGTRLVTGTGEVPLVFAQLLPLWTVYISLMGVSGAKRIDQSLREHFANVDLSAALRASNNEALRGRQEAEAANSAKTNFLANMSHELRTPLNAILGFSDIIAQQSLGPQAVARYSEYASDIHASGAHLLSLINDLLDVAKIEAGKMEIEPRPLDAAAAVADIERLIGPRARQRRQTIRCEIAPDLPLLVADDRAFRQIALNLLSNAVKFTPEDGRIDIALQRSGNGGLLLEVADNGPGIPEEKLERVFEPFSQIDNRYGRQSGGTGLGLALVKGLVDLHGGRVWIESAPERGTKVYVYFPLVTEFSAPAQVMAG